MAYHPHNSEPSASAIVPTHPVNLPRRDGWTAEQQRGFCEALAECGLVDYAAAAVGMSRETAYRLRRRSEGKAFALAWEAAFILAQQRLNNEAFELAFQGSVEQTWRDGKLITEKRRRDPRIMLATIERLGAAKILGNAPVQAVAQEFDEFLDCMVHDAQSQGHATARVEFMAEREDRAGLADRKQLDTSTLVLRRTAQS